MEISKSRVDELFLKYKPCIAPFIRQYSSLPPCEKPLIEQAALIGVWNGIKACYRRVEKEPEEQELLDTIFAYIRWSVKDFLKNENKSVRIPDNQWKTFNKISRLIEENPDATENELCKLLQNKNQIKHYNKIKELLKLESLNIEVGEGEKEERSDLIGSDDETIQKMIEQNHLRYVINSALAAFDKKRDREIICKWLISIYSSKELNHGELAKRFGLSRGMIKIILDQFKDICEFIEMCENKFALNPNGSVCFYKLIQKRESRKKVY